jgi:hypothetical protein
MTDGKHGELTVLVDRQVVARKWLFFKPSVETVLKAVRDRLQSTTQAKG